MGDYWVSKYDICADFSKMTDNSDITISIVTPSFNQGIFLEETIKSVISQEGEFFIDYIIMDGGSTDDTVKIIKKYDELIKSDSWKPRCRGIEFRWVSEKDMGQTHAINKGFRIAKGQIVSWINSDDLYCNNAFSVVMDHFTRHPGDDFIFGDGDVVNEHGGLQWEWLSRPYNFTLLKSYHFLWNDFTNYIMQQATFWRMSVFEKIGFLDESYHYAMDIEYWLRIGRAGLKAVHIPSKLGKFRMIEGTKSLSSPTAFWPESLEMFRTYNGADAMEPFLRYYFYNEGLYNVFDLSIMKQREKELFDKWKYLSEKELSILKDKSAKGFDKACLMLAYEAFLTGDDQRERVLFKNAISHNPLLRLHYRALYLSINKLIGRNLATSIKKKARRLVNTYRMRRYLYRYL